MLRENGGEITISIFGKVTFVGDDDIFYDDADAFLDCIREELPYPYRMKKTDTERLKKIVSLWDALSSEIERRGITREMLLTEQFSQWAVTTPVYNIGEQVYQLSPEFKKEHPDIPWSVVSGLRHRLVHDYDGINWSLIADVIFDDMNPFVEQVKSILSE